jgi:3,4-dihydroxy-2-butanone 4-phosphate synthase
MTQQKWTRTDLVDVVSLPPAVVYCDVVVTEWRCAQRPTADGTARRFGTVVISRLADLTNVLQGIPADD